MRWTVVAIPLLLLVSAAVAGDEDPVLAAQRAANLEVYEASREALHRDHEGSWAVIADGEITLVPDLERAAAVAPKARHRFVFRVGEEGDDEIFVTEWYGPRFAGPGLSRALGFDYVFGRGWHRGDEVIPTPGVKPFPRTPLLVGAPGEKAESLDVFIGTVGPPLALTPEDFERLGLARFEVPGTMLVGGVPCRRATVEVEVEGLEGKATLTAAVPAISKEKIVDLGRGRGFWFFLGPEKGLGIWAQMPEAHAEGWVLFGVDRVLGRGESAAEALLAGEGKAPEAYHRFLCRLPRRGELRYEADAFTIEEERVLNGERVTVRRSERYGPDILLADPVDAYRMRLHLAEDAVCTFVVKDGKRLHARCGAAWAGDRRPGEAVAPDAKPLPLVHVVCPLPEGQTVWYCEPPPSLPEVLEPK